MMKKKFLSSLLLIAVLIGLLPSGGVIATVSAADDLTVYKTENVVVPEGWDYVEVSTVDELLATAERHGSWDNDGVPMFVRLTADLEMKDKWVGRFNQACICVSYRSTTVLDFNGHKIKCEINAAQNSDSHTWYGLQIQLCYGVCPDFYFRIVDSVGGGGVWLDAYTDVDGPTTAMMIKGVSLYGYSNATAEMTPYRNDGVRVYIDGGVYSMFTSNDKFCLVQGGPLHDSYGHTRWGGYYSPYTRSTVGLEEVKAEINNGYFATYYPPEKSGWVADMGIRFLSNLGLADQYSAEYLRINGGKFPGGCCYSVYMYSNMSLFSDSEYLDKLNPMPVINGGEFGGGIQFCSTRTSFWRKLHGKYDLNPKMKDVKVSEILIPGAKMYMDGKLIDPDKKDLEDVAWPHALTVEPGPQITDDRLVNNAVATDAYTGLLIRYNKTPDSVKLQEYITVIRLGKEQSYWADAEGSYYTLQTSLGENWYNFFIPAKHSSATAKFRAVADFGGVRVTSREYEVEWIDFSDFEFTYGPVWHDGNGEGVAYVDFDVSHRNAVAEYGLYWLENGDHWKKIYDVSYLNQDYNNGKFRFFISELADPDSDSTEYCVIVRYKVGNVENNLYSEGHVFTVDDLGAPADPYSVSLDVAECTLLPDESKTIKVTLFPTAAPHKTDFTVESSDPGVVQLVGQGEDYFTVTARGKGEATVTVTAVGGASASLSVTVVDDAATDLCLLSLFADATDPAPVSVMKIKKGAKGGEIDALGKEGATFAGWFTNRSLTKPYDPAAPITEDTGLFPKWEGESPLKFVDVKIDDYFCDAVIWAVANGITKGMDATHFSPNSTCTRAQVVTFLWRTAGEPEPSGSKNPFSDVKADDYFFKAVLWAVENGITAGTSKTAFSPNDGCTRAQVVTFLWRTEGKPAQSGSNPFFDVHASEYYYDAVLWAVEKGITKGTDATHFSPSNVCTRAQIVTFLYRNAAK